MTCGGCASSVTEALKAIDGVREVNVSLAAGEATIQYDEKLASADQLKSAVRGAGYGVGATNAGNGPKAGGCCCS
jgi:copper chaperone CopZ